MASYYQACAEEGAETQYLNNPGDHPYDEDNFERPEYEILEVEDRIIAKAMLPLPIVCYRRLKKD